MKTYLISTKNSVYNKKKAKHRQKHLLLAKNEKKYLPKRFQGTELFALIILQFKTCIFYKKCKQKLIKPTTWSFF